jgi:hypothetical protein
MRVCDRHSDRRAIDAVIIHGDDSRFDVCAECKSELLALLCSPVVSDEAAPGRVRGRPLKSSTTTS